MDLTIGLYPFAPYPASACLNCSAVTLPYTIHRHYDVCFHRQYHGTVATDFIPIAVMTGLFDAFWYPAALHATMSSFRPLWYRKVLTHVTALSDRSLIYSANSVCTFMRHGDFVTDSFINVNDVHLSARGLIEPLRTGLIKLHDVLSVFKYETRSCRGLVETFTYAVKEYLQACRRYPDAVVRAVYGRTDVRF